MSSSWFFGLEFPLTVWSLVASLPLCAWGIAVAPMCLLLLCGALAALRGPPRLSRAPVLMGSDSVFVFVLFSAVFSCFVALVACFRAERWSLFFSLIKIFFSFRNVSCSFKICNNA